MKVYDSGQWRQGAQCVVQYPPLPQLCAALTLREAQADQVN